MNDARLVIRPRAWLLFGCLAALVVAPLALFNLPNPFEGLAPGERPSRFIMVLWVCAALIFVLALWRLATWRTYRVDARGVEARGWFGGRMLSWNELTAASLGAPIGMPPAYELRFGKVKIRLIAAHHDPRDIQKLRDLAPKA